MKKPALLLVATALLAACGAESSGLLSDHLVCNTTADGLEAQVAALDAANEGKETNIVLPGSSSSQTQPGLAQYFSTGAEELNIWGVAIKLVAPSGAAGDVSVQIIDNNIAVTSVPFTYASKLVEAAQIGYTPTWLLVNFGEFTTLQENQTFRIALSGVYTRGNARPVSWVTIAGTGLETFVPETILTPAAWTSTGRAGVHILESCQ